MKGKCGVLMILFVFSTFFLPVEVNAQDTAKANLTQAQSLVDQALLDAKQQQLSQAKSDYRRFHDRWLQIEEGIKQDSPSSYRKIESNMGQVDYAFIKKDDAAVIQALQGLKKVNDSFIQGEYSDSGTETSSHQISLAQYIEMLRETGTASQNHNQAKALQSIKQVRESWLSVEGKVVAQSAQVYADTERDMVTVQAMLSANTPDYQKADHLIQRMVSYLTPLTAKTGYTIWDAAMIPIREGLEALLVIGALLAYARKAESRQGKGWVLSGVGAGILVSILLAVLVKLLFSSGAFGHNNYLIAGWTGVIAAVMLLYMSYWLHRQSNIKAWQQFLRQKSESALSSGRMISLGILAFLAVFREGTETVLFIIGMVNQISIQQLLLGLFIGLLVLLAVAYLMLFVGLKMPLRPFFLVSSLIVFYLCIKFTGLGIHSLQLADILPSTHAPLPSWNLIAFYPNWQSAAPQMVLVAAALFLILWKKTNKSTKTQVTRS